MPNQCRHGDAHYIAPSAPFRGRACCKRYMPGFVAFGFCVWARFGSGFRAKHSRQSAISFGGELGFRLWGNPAQPQDVFAHSVFWFLAPWVTLVQRIGSRHSGLGVTIKCRATGI